MSSHTKKLAVLHCLSQESDPISLYALLKKLGGDYAERSVRRWLSEMINEGVVEKLGAKKTTTYRVILREKRQLESTQSLFSQESAKAINYVRQPIYERPPVAYSDEWFDDYIPNQTFYIPAELRERLRQAGKRSSPDDPAGTYAHQIFNRLLIDLSYNSSRLEGNTYSLLDTKKLLLQGDSALGKLDEEKVMILNHIEAIRYIVDTAPRLEVTKEAICTIHYLLADGLVESQFAGKVRDRGVRIGGSTYIPFEGPRQLLIRLNRVAEKARLIHDPYEQSLFLLVHLSYLQAFSDVNKRTARISCNIPLIKSNLVPLSFNDVERLDYMSAMIVIYEMQDVRPILDLYVFSYMRTAAEYDATVQSLGFDELRVRYRIERRAIIREIILNQLHGQSLQDYVTANMPKFEKEQSRQAFFEDVMEDLEGMDVSRIAGLGVTREQLIDWMAARPGLKQF